ncbi:MAG: hypothetical protein AAGA72_03440 [Pseudomonadota bacterium]
MNSILKSSVALPILALAACQSADTSFGQPTTLSSIEPSPPFTDRHLIDVSNLREFYEGMMIGDMMIHADAMFSAETKWKMTLYQAIHAGSAHHQVRSAYQLAYLGVPLDEITAVWAPNYIETIEDERLNAAFQYIDQIATLPSRVDADTHAMLRQHYTDRQIAELIELAAFNAANALLDSVLPVPTDQATLDWAAVNLSATPWQVGRNQTETPGEQRAALFAGDLMEAAYQEILENWDRVDLSAPEADFESDWLNRVTGYDISRVTIDRDKDGVEDPFDTYPLDPDRWRPSEAMHAKSTLNAASAPFDVAAFDRPYYSVPSASKATYPYSDRIRFDTEWTRQNAMGTSRIEDYFAAGDRALPMKFMWQFFVVYQLSSGCVHCQVHGTRWLYEFLEDEHNGGPVPDSAMGDIYDLFDFERSDRFGAAELAAFRLARDAGRLPTQTTAAHIEALRAHYSDREIQELMMILAAGGRLSAGQQGNVTVTDRTSMAWALRELTPIGWRPGGHIGLPQEQRRLFMSEIEMVVMTGMMSGGAFDFASEWVGLPVPRAIDSDADGVEDAFDGFPDDPTRWEDTDRDGIEDMDDPDIDGDGLSNAKERSLGTFPYKADSDGDGVLDALEVEAGTDPVNPMSL